jgi:hypothetical protein
VISNNMSVYLALGKPYLSTLVLATRAVVFLIGVAVFVSGSGVVAVAWAEFVAAVGYLAVGLPVLFSSMRLRTSGLHPCLVAPAAGKRGGAAAVHSAVSALGRSETFSVALLQLVVGLAVGGLVYPAAMAALESGRAARSHRDDPRQANQGCASQTRGEGRRAGCDSP